MTEILAALTNPKQLFALGMIKEALTEGLSANTAIQAFRNAGFSMRTSTFNDLFRYAKFENDSGAYIASLPSNRIPDPNLATTAISRTRDEFGYRVQLTGYDPFTLQPKTDNVMVWSEEGMSIAEIRQEAFNMLLSNPERYKMIATQADVVGFIKAGPEGTL